MMITEIIDQVDRIVLSFMRRNSQVSSKNSAFMLCDSEAALHATPDVWQ